MDLRMFGASGRELTEPTVIEDGVCERDLIQIVVDEDACPPLCFSGDSDSDDDVELACSVQRVA